MLYATQYHAGKDVIDGKYGAHYVPGYRRHPNVIARLTRRDGFKTSFGSELRIPLIATMFVLAGFCLAFFGLMEWLPYLIGVGSFIICASLLVIAVNIDSVRFVFDERKRKTANISDAVVIPYNANEFRWSTLYHSLNGLDEMVTASQYSPLSKWVEAEIRTPSPLCNQLCFVIDLYLRRTAVIFKDANDSSSGRELMALREKHLTVASQSAISLYRILRSTPEPRWVGQLRNQMIADSLSYR